MKTLDYKITNLNNGIIYTNDDCIGCNKCISSCPIFGANVATKEDEKNVVRVDADKCIHCGKCLEVCEHKAREYKDDTEDFLRDLSVGKKISLLVAPSFLTNYPNQYKQVLGYLKSLGVNHIYSVSFGADITTWAYLKYITEHNETGYISQPCPAIVNYIEKFKPELLSKLIPVHSPLLCTAIYMKEYLKLEDSLAFLSPCIAKKDEINNPNTKGYVKYNITYAHLMEKLADVPLNYEATDEIEYGLGSIYPLPGGLRENVEHFIGLDQLVRQVEGENHVYKYFDLYANRIKENKKLPILLDALNCSQGCNFGTGTESKLTMDDDVLFEIQKLRSNPHKDKTDPFNKDILPKERLKRLNKKFQNLRLEDFLRNYNHDCSIVDREVFDEEIQEIFRSMYKTTKENQEINCSSCGYSGCKEMAIAIALGFNEKGNCVHYIKDEILESRNQSIALTMELENKTKKEELFKEIAESFEKLNAAIDDVAAGNNATAERTMSMAQTISELSNYGNLLERSLTEVKNSIHALEEAIY